MCFRPAAASTPKTCPACGMINPAVADKCVKCGAEDFLKTASNARTAGR